MFFFPFGAVVLWGFPGEEEERALIDRLAALGGGGGGGTGEGDSESLGGDAEGDQAGGSDDDGDRDSIYPEIDFLYDKAVAEQTAEEAAAAAAEAEAEVRAIRLERANAGSRSSGSGNNISEETKEQDSGRSHGGRPGPLAAAAHHDSSGIGLELGPSPTAG